MKKLYIVCDYREKFPSISPGTKVYNDHISKESMINLIDTIKKCGYDAEYFGGVDELIKFYHQKIKMPDGIFINLNDGLSEKHKRGQTPLLLEMLKVPYSGSDPFHTLLVNDKYFTNLCLQQNKILCPNSVLISNKSDLSQINELNPPIIVKPNYEGSSIGVLPSNFCNDVKSAVNTALKLLNNFDDILVQEYIPGYEVTNLIIRQKDSNEILFNEPLSLSYNDQIFLNNEVFGKNEKSSNIRQYRLASQILNTTTVETIKQLSAQIIFTLHLFNFVRIDYRINGEKVYFIEANTNPAFGRNSDVGKCCNLLNISFEDFVSLFIKSLFNKYNNN